MIDATGTFDVSRLHQAIVFHLKAQNAAKQALYENVEDLAEQALESVKIMRVFDFVGVSEAINELRAELQASPEIPADQPRNAGLPRQIPDSEGEDNDDDMLLDIPAEPGALDKVASSEQVVSKNVKFGLILIDNIAHVVNPLLKSNYAQGIPILPRLIESLLTRLRSSALHYVHALTITPDRKVSNQHNPRQHSRNATTKLRHADNNVRTSRHMDRRSNSSIAIHHRSAVHLRRKLSTSGARETLDLLY